jgi:hypothetical protein
MSDSWWLKVKRAQKHMVDINKAVRLYKSSEPYEFVPIRQPDYKGEVWRRIKITNQPDPILPFMLGDFVHNLRTALDHVVVACVPKKHRSGMTEFPILYEDIWKVDEHGQFVVKNDKLRNEFESKVRGIDPSARALIIQAQPYHYGADAFRNGPGVISRLDNLDKHRDIITFGSGVKNIVGTVLLGGRRFPLEGAVHGGQFMKDGAVIVWKLRRNPVDGSLIKPSEVNVDFRATTIVHVKVSRLGGNQQPADFRLIDAMLHAISDVRLILRKLEPFVIR